MTTQEQFLKTYDECADDIFRYCYFRVFDRDLAADLTQDAFIKTWNQIRQGQKIKNPKAFVYKVARNLIIDNSRKKREQSLDEMRDQGFDAVFAENIGNGDLVDIKTALELLESLEEQYREVIIMRYVEGYGPKEIAEMLDDSPNAVSIRINRGLDKLRSLINHAD